MAIIQVVTDLAHAAPTRFVSIRVEIPHNETLFVDKFTNLLVLRGGVLTPEC